MLLFDRMVGALLTLTLLTADPAVDVPLAHTKLRISLSVGGLMGSVWVSPAFRSMVDRAEQEGMVDLSTHGSPFDSQYLLQGMPAVGPWVLLATGGQQERQDMWLLVTSGVLQAVGLTALTWSFLSQRGEHKADAAPGLELSISPVVANRLGLCLTLTGF